jgi:hypothetical protein
MREQYCKLTDLSICSRYCKFTPQFYVMCILWIFISQYLAVMNLAILKVLTPYTLTLFGSQYKGFNKQAHIGNELHKTQDQLLVLYCSMQIKFWFNDITRLYSSMLNCCKLCLHLNYIIGLWSRNFLFCFICCFMCNFPTIKAMNY